MRVAIVTDAPGWHGAALEASFLKKGVEAVSVSLHQCGLHINTDQHSDLVFNSHAVTQAIITLPGFASRLPDAVFVRGVSGGTLQQVITRLNILHILQDLGVLVYNAPRAIERTVDKAMTSFLLHRQGIKTPATWVCESRQAIEDIRAQWPDRSFVLKPLFGSQGIGVRLLTPNTPCPVPMMQYVDGVYYLQAFIDSIKNARVSGRTQKDVPLSSYHDYRVFVIGGRVVAAMRRSGPDWINNVAAGAQCEAIQAPAELRAIALAAAKAIDIHYCGVDVIQAHNGDYFVLEVNSIPAWRGLQSVSDIHIADALVEDFLFAFKQRTAKLKRHNEPSPT